MIRFFAGIEQLEGIKREEQLAALLPKMTDFVQLRDRDAQHLLVTVDLIHPTDLMYGIDPGKLARRMQRVVRQLDLGRGCEFSRLPLEPTDDGLDAAEMRAMAVKLIAVAAKAANLKQRVIPLRFSSRLVR